MSAIDTDLIRAVSAVDDAMRSGDVGRATALAGVAAKLGAERPQLLVLAVYDAIDRGEPARALEYADRARAAARHDPEVLNAYGVALFHCNRAKQALAVYDAALRQAPDRAGIHYNKGCALDALGLSKRARLSFERAVALKPDHAQALGRLAYLAVMRGERALARGFGERALKVQPGEITAALALATVEIEEKRFDQALARAHRLLADPATIDVNRALAQGLAADALDGLSRHAEAFRAYGECNRTLCRLFRDTYQQEGMVGARTLAERLADYFRTAPAEDWRVHAPPPAGGKSQPIHVFLVGFPRCGTTLLEQVLASHPDVVGMDERDCFAEAKRAFFATPGDLDRLARASEKELEPFRKAYWRGVGEQDITPTKKVFLDKMPLNSINLCLIAKLFPQARVLFALRDPVDVVWSAFRRRFGMNAHMYELLTLEGAARYYDAVMTLAELYREKLGLAWHDTVYERTVGAFEAEIRAICAFLGLEWTDKLTEFAAKARERAPDTPSGPQVARGLYATAVGQWQVYRDQLAPILPILAPWRDRFGYSVIRSK
jgi:Flp pilus assembly protein TadD